MLAFRRQIGIQGMYFNKNEALKILTIGGGSGQYTLLSGLRDIKNIEITAVASMADNGGSTGRLRDELGVLPPGDILKCVIALSPLRDTAKKIMLKTLKGDRRLQGHKAGNMLITMLSRYTGSFPAAIQTLSEILEVSGRVLPGTTNKATLVAELVDGSRIYGESAIDIPQSTQREQIKDLFLVPHHNGSISAYPPVVEAIKFIKEAIQSTNAIIFYILNIMTKFGETHNFKGNDFIQKVETYLGRQVDGIICNNRKPSNRLLKKYLAEKSEFVEIERFEKRINNRLIYADDLLDSSDEIVRHDSKKLASLIQSIISQEHFFECIKLTNNPILMQFVLKDSVKMPITHKSVKALQRIA
jgi:2-phospho-L-lactate transferase/gluconeogenesis factor (CofD/UPF0052 family)